MDGNRCNSSLFLPDCFISSQHGKNDGTTSLGSIMTDSSQLSSSSSSSSPKNDKKRKSTKILGRSYACTQSELRIEQLKSEIEALKPQIIKRLI